MTFPMLQSGSQLFAHHYGVQVNTMHADWNKLFLGLGSGYVVKYDFQVRTCWAYEIYNTWDRLAVRHTTLCLMLALPIARKIVFHSAMNNSALI